MNYPDYEKKIYELEKVMMLCNNKINEIQPNDCLKLRELYKKLSLYRDRMVEIKKRDMIHRTINLVSTNIQEFDDWKMLLT